MRARQPISRAQVAELFHRPLLDLLHDAQRVHREHQPVGAIQRATLLSVKTGGCPEDCGYCPQSAHHETEVERQPLLDLETVVRAARAAKDGGSTRFCMGGAYRDLPDGDVFERVLEMVKAVDELGLETCLTMGMLEEGQARRLKDAGLKAYNHNLDTSEATYGTIVSTRSYQDRLATIARVSAAGIDVCCGGIVGMGESDDDRIDLLHALAVLDPHPESVPVNALVPVAGTPLGDRPPVDGVDLARVIATARILMPGSRIRLSAGRRLLSDSDHALCFLAGANSIFAGDRLLTTPNAGDARDEALLRRLGLVTMDRESEPASESTRA